MLDGYDGLRGGRDDTRVAFDRIDVVVRLSRKHNAQLARINARLDAHGARVDDGFEQVDARFRQVEQRLDFIGVQLAQLARRLAS